MITIHQRHRQTDGRTDGQTTCDRKTALCIVVHRAVKTEIKLFYFSFISRCATGLSRCEI